MPRSANFGLRAPLRVLFDAELEPDEKVLYAFLAAVPNHDPSYEQISEALAYSPKRIARALRALAASGWVEARRARRVKVNGRIRFAGTTKYTLRDGGRQFVLMPPAMLQRLVETRPRNSAASALLVALYDHTADRTSEQLPHGRVAQALHVSRDTVKRARKRGMQNGSVGGQPGRDLDRSVDWQGVE